MFGYAIIRRFYKTYIVLPLLLYACVMYRVLETTCGDKQKIDEEAISLNKHYDPKSRKIMQFSGNRTDYLNKIVHDYEELGQKRKQVLESLQSFMSRNALQYDENYIINEIKYQLNNHASENRFRKDSELSKTNANNVIRRPRYLLNCSNIHEVRLISKIGHGVSKQTYKGEFKGIPVAVKMVTRHQSEVKSCIDKINEAHPKKTELRSRCFVFSSMRLMKEILLLEQMAHPGFAQLLGYCIRNEESETVDLTERGIVSIFELGERIMFYNLQTLTWRQRLSLATELADFLNYLEHSPLGSLRIRDFKEEHFLMINGSLKMIDLDEVDNLEPICNVYVNADSQAELARNGVSNGCEFNLACHRGLCVGFNAKQNMKFMNKLFFKRLLFPTVFPKMISQEMGLLLAEIDDNQITAGALSFKLLHIQEMMQ